MFVVYNDEGEIIATMIGPGPEYGRDTLDKEGKRWLFLEGVTSLEPLQTYVDVATGAVKSRQPMPLTVDGATVSGIPAGSIAHVSVADQWQLSETIDDGELELDAETPAAYRVLFTCCGYLPTEFEIDIP